MKKLKFLSLLILISLFPALNMTSAEANSYTLKVENQPVCLNSLKSIWIEFGSPFPCFVNGSEVVLIQPSQANSKLAKDVYFQLNNKIMDISSNQVIISPSEYQVGLNKAYFYVKDSNSGDEQILGSPVDFIIYNSISRQRLLSNPKQNYTVLLKKQVNSVDTNLSDFDLQSAIVYSRDSLGKNKKYQSDKIFTADLDLEELKSLKDTDLIESISVTSFVYPSSTQSNPPSWGLDRIDQDRLPLDRKYSYGRYTGTNVNVYVIDSGLNMTHTEFSGRILRSGSVYDDAEDCNGHGTHVAGTILGQTFGVAKNARVIPVRVFPCEGGVPSSYIQAAMEWVIEDHEEGVPAVVNMSLGGGPNSVTDELIQSMIDDGLVVVVAAGNDSDDACDKSPARAANAITVGSSTNEDKDSSFSNIGPCVDVFAPGSSINSSWIGSPSASATISGTSMASPHVAGVAALILERIYSSLANKEEANNEVLSIILENASENIMTPCCGRTTGWWGSTVNLLLKTSFLLLPENSLAPTIASSTGSFGVGATITATSTAAHWTGSPVPKLTFQWQKYVGSSWVAITGATRNTFKLTANETGFKVRIAVTATNTYGATTAYSDESGVVG
jgi:subtilisin family serine protease